MLFSSIPFLYYFLPLTFLLYFLVPKSCKNAVLLIASLVFYGWGEPQYVFLMIASIIVGYISGLLIEVFHKRGRAKIILVLSVVINLGLLGYFKYADFFIENFNAVTGLSVPMLRLALPIGISFYTFQILSYVVDVYRKEVPAQKNLISLAAYIAMFPQLIAGPIVRYSTINEQIGNRRTTWDDLAEGIKRFVLGLGKKVLIANQLGELSQAFRASDEKTFLFYWLYAIAVMLHIYFDFSGYSDMAIGLGRMLGFTFLENFNYPFMSKSVTEFWRRWHISLSSWLRDYLYIPLGGNRRGRVRTYLNLFITMLLGGLWHGVGMTFLAWGALHGIALALHKVWLAVVPNAKVVGRDMKPIWRVCGIVLCFHIVAFGWLLFAADSMTTVEDMLHSIAHSFAIADLRALVESHGAFFVVMALGYLMHLMPCRFDGAVRGAITRGGFVVQLVVMVVAVWLVMQCDMLLTATADGGGALPMYAAF